MRTCDYCGVSIEGKRANARFCSSGHRVYGLRQSRALPAEMRGVDRWVRWARVPRGERVTKVPLQTTGAYASTRRPETWASYDTVAASTVGHGVGFVLGAGIGCIDLDHCLTGGKVQDWARETISEYRDRALLIEVSPSGHGIHIFLPMEQGAGRVIRDGRNIEIYPPDSGRYMTVTGERWA